MRVLELFAGIGACSTALTRLGIEHEIVDAVEIDKYAMASFNAIHGTHFEPQDITTWDKELTDIDLIMHGSPCQDFSIAGKQAGGDENSGTRSSLMYETVRIVGKIKPKYVIWENVKNILSQKHRHNFEKYLVQMQELGYNNYYQVLNAKDYGIPQNRERVFTVSIRQDIDTHTFKFPEKQVLKLRLKDMLEEEVDEKYYLSDKQIASIKATSFTQAKNRIQENEYADCLLGRDWKDPKCVEVERIGGMFDTDMRTKQESFVENKYKNFIEKNGYIPEMFNPYNETEIRDIAPTQSTYCGSNTLSATVLIKNATKQGYLEAHEGDEIDISSRMKYHRGNVQSQIVQTLVTNGNERGVVVRDKEAVNDNTGVVVLGNYSQSGYESSRIVDEAGIAPTVKENHGTVTAVAQRGREGGQQMEISNREYANSLTTVQKDSMIAEKIGNIYPSGGQNGNVYATNGLSPTISSGIGIKGNGIGSNNAPKIQSDLRIRKLTPKECFRLMGFKDEEFERASKVCSNSQLYKQAGNSIVVNVLEEILKNLFGSE